MPLKSMTLRPPRILHQCGPLAILASSTRLIVEEQGFRQFSCPIPPVLTGTRLLDYAIAQYMLRRDALRKEDAATK